MSYLGKVSEEGSLIKEDVGTQNENKGYLEEETTFSFVGDAITHNDGRVLRLFYNNCNGLEINRHIRAQVG